MTDGDWKTLRVPPLEYEAAKNHKETHDETWGDVLAFYADHREQVYRGDLEKRVTKGDVESILNRLDDLESQLPRKIAREIQG